ncbi:MAG: DUF4398 domain-containing protein [Candidatus Zixiibacteriota bacterium]|nr:MAG: DUF4398 domain-containing protein [candidate division Zixibacteria bacterium]
MKRGVLFVGLLMVPVFLLVLGCGGEPTNELAAAKGALENARAAEADKYAPDVFTQAENSIAEAENLIAQKKYREAKKLLMDAKNVAETAATQAATNKDNTKTEVEDYLAAIDQGMKQLKETQDLAKQWGIPKKERELADELAAWNVNLEKARAEYDAGNYYAAKELAASVHQELVAKDSGLREAIMAKQK